MYLFVSDDRATADAAGGSRSPSGPWTERTLGDRLTSGEASADGSRYLMTSGISSASIQRASPTAIRFVFR